MKVVVFTSKDWYFALFDYLVYHFKKRGSGGSFDDDNTCDSYNFAFMLIIKDARANYSNHILAHRMSKSQAFNIVMERTQKKRGQSWNITKGRSFMWS